jgi:hypothetical protein
MKVRELIAKLQSLDQDLEVRTEGDEQLSLCEPRPRVEYYREYGKGPDTPTYDKSVIAHFNHDSKKWEDVKMTPVVIV